MKKISALIAMLLCVTGLFAGTYMNDLTNDMLVYGYVNEYCVLEINPITATESSDGLPFNIDGNDVAYGSTGRRVATWSLATNSTTLTLKFSAEPMYLSGDTSQYLNYYLYLAYSYEGLDEDSQSVTNTGTITVYSDDDVTTVSFPQDGETGNEPIVSSNQNITLSFDSETTEKLSTLSQGMYYGTVTITMEAP